MRSLFASSSFSAIFELFFEEKIGSKFVNDSAVSSERGVFHALSLSASLFLFFFLTIFSNLQRCDGSSMAAAADCRLRHASAFSAGRIHHNSGGPQGSRRNRSGKLWLRQSYETCQVRIPRVLSANESCVLQITVSCTSWKIDSIQPRHRPCSISVPYVLIHDYFPTARDTRWQSNESV